MAKKCEMTVGGNDLGHMNYYPCGKPAKFRTPKPLISGTRKNVCGIHRRSVDKMHERCGSVARCTEIDPVQTDNAADTPGGNEG